MSKAGYIQVQQDKIQNWFGNKTLPGAELVENAIM